MDKKKLSTTVTEDFYELVLRNAEKEKLSISSYLTKLLKENVNTNLEENIDETEPVKGKNYNVVLDADTTYVLEDKARTVGLNRTAYLRNLIHTTNFTIYRVATNDIEELIDEVHRANTLMSSCVSIMRRKGLDEDCSPEINEINYNSEMIKRLLARGIAEMFAYRRKIQEQLASGENKTEISVDILDILQLKKEEEIKEIKEDVVDEEKVDEPVSETVIASSNEEENHDKKASSWMNFLKRKNVG